MTPSVLCVGIAVLDRLYRVPAIPATPTKCVATDHKEVGGGSAASAAVAASRLGGRVSLWARVGDDDIATRILDQLAADGVDASGVRRLPNARSGSSAILIDEAGERLIANFPGGALDLDPGWLPLGSIARHDVVLGDLRWHQGTATALRAARVANRRTVLDADLNAYPETRDLLPLADEVVFSAPYLARVTETSDLADGLRRARDLGIGLVGVTSGAGGFHWLEGGEMRHAAGFAVAAIDTLAAGDVFHGAYALARAEGRTVAEAGRFANAAAALKCTRFGGRDGAPTRMEVDQFLRNA